ncbi:MAG TPA: tetratricopeptide repeat protein [Gallionella sp.]|nr:tetratricopeptide repeat protein [Gallionella sp.]
MNMFNRFSETHLARFGETLFARFHHYAALLTGILLLSANPAVYADDIQDANKLFKQGQHSQALDKVNGVLAGKPKDAQARFLKGLILTEQGKTAEAIKTFSTLTEDYPELPEPYNNLAVLYASQGQYDKAKLALEMAIRTHPSYATAHENLGDIYAKMASQAYDRALQLDRSNTATQTKLAMIQDLFAGGTRGKAAPARNNPVLSKVEGPALGKVEGAAPVSEPASKPESAKLEPAAPAAAKPAPVAEKSPEPAPAPKANSSGEVLKAVNAWAAAWSAKNVNKYLSFYAADFKVPDGESRAAWETARRERISKPKSIQVGISGATVNFSDGTHATVKFRQSYRASHLKTSGNKTLLMVKSGGNWLIQEERTK